MKLVYVNGNLVPAEEASVSVFDHGFLYGDGVFEGIRVYNGRIFKLDEHLERLYDSAHVIMLRIPLSKEEMRRAVIDTVRANGIRDGYIRLVVSRGPGDLGLDPRKCSKPTVVIIADTIQLYPEELYEKGLKVVTVPTRRNIPEALNPRIKSLNYLNNILAKIEANNFGDVVHEAIMLDVNGYVVECTGDNIFIVDNGILITPPTYIGALEGITRNTVIELAKEMGVRVEESLLTRYNLYVADECFLTGTAAEVVPVAEVDGRKIGNEVPGKITSELMKRFREKTMTEGVPVYEGG
jgi:branched-chain amino acid aminotransferase